MPTVAEHYNDVLADVYIWMCGGFDSGIEKNIEFFKTHQIHPYHSKVAVDLGAGCSFQSIPLAQLGFSVYALDLDQTLLHKLKEHSDGLSIHAIQDNLLHFTQHIDQPVELIVCMTDTLLHLESLQQVQALFHTAIEALEKEGRFILTFRDLSFELSELERFIPVKSDENTLFTCFLEYEKHTVKVHDLVHQKVDGKWNFNKSYYRKLRLSKDWVETQLFKAGFTQVQSSVNKGFVTILADKVGPTYIK